MIRLDLDAKRDRELALGAGVTIRYRLATYADYLVARQASQIHMADALREAREEAEAEGAKVDATRIAAEAEAVFAERMVAQCATGWEGVTTPEGEPLPLDARTWRAFADFRPELADKFVLTLRLPHEELELEGNGFWTSSPGG